MSLSRSFATLRLMIVMQLLGHVLPFTSMSSLLRHAVTSRVQINGMNQDSVARRRTFVSKASFIAEDDVVPSRRSRAKGLMREFKPSFPQKLFEDAHLPAAGAVASTIVDVGSLSHFFSALKEQSKASKDITFFPMSRSFFKQWAKRLNAAGCAALLSYCALNTIWYTLGLTLTWRRIVPVSSMTTYGSALVRAHNPFETLSNALFTLHVGSQVMVFMKAILVLSMSPLAYAYIGTLHRKFKVSHKKILGFSMATMASTVIATWTTVLCVAILGG